MQTSPLSSPPSSFSLPKADLNSHSFGSKSVCFLTPQQNHQKNNDDNVINFQIDFRNPTFTGYLVPKDIDKYWCGVGCQVSYVKVYDQLKSKTENEIMEIFHSQLNENCSPLSIAFRKLVECFPLTFKESDIIPFLSQPKLNINLFYSLISDESKYMFSSVLLLVKTLLPKISSNKNKQDILSLFGQWLIPKEIIDNCGQSNSQCVLFLPVKNGRFHQWLILNRDKSIIISTIEGNEIVAQRKDYQVVRNYEVVIIGNREFSFLDHEMYMFFISGMKTKDQLKKFILSFKYALPFYDKLSPLLKKKIVEHLSEPGMIFASALFNHPSSVLTKDVCFQILNCLLSSGMFAPFVRYAFAGDVESTEEVGTIFRGTSPATATSSTLLTVFGSDIVQQIVKKIKSAPNDSKNAVRITMESFNHLPIAMHFLLNCVFRATRRKFPENRVPLVAVGSILMLRLVLPTISQDESISKLGKHMMSAFVFKKDDKEISDDKLFSEIAQFIIDIIKMSDKAVTLNTLDAPQLAKFIAENNEKIISKYEEIQQMRKQEKHPLVPSMVEMIENCFIDQSDEFSKILNNCNLFV